MIYQLYSREKTMGNRDVDMAAIYFFYYWYYGPVRPRRVHTE